MGTLFGCIYFMVKLCDLGLSKILMSFFLDYSQNQQAVYSFLKSQVIPTILLYCMVAVIFLCAHHVFIPKSIVSINNQLIIILLTIIAIEIIKAITKKLLQLSLHFRHIALCEIALIVWYPVIIWLYYYAYNTLPILFIFSSFAVLSAIETMCLIYF